MKRWMSILAIGISLLFFSSAHAQITNAALSGTVADSTEAVIPGATVTVENLKTGVKTTTTTNSAGVYTFPSLQPGTYRLTAEKDGFKKMAYDPVTLELSARVTLNFALEVGTTVADSVQVSASLDTQLAIGTSSVGGVVNGRRVQELPLPGRDALGLVLTQGGLVGSNFSGARIGTLNVALDGVNVMDQRINSGVNSNVFTSVDVIDEVRVITSPADAEFGRGSGQVLLSIKSGGNQFHGSLFEAHRNTVLTANTWFNNLNGIPRNGLIRNQFGGNFSGPIIKNKTHFFFNYDGQRQVTKNATTATVYTPSAKQGLYRFFPGVRNGNVNAAIPVVDVNGSPVKPASATGDLQAINVFTYDSVRRAADTTGLVKRYLDLMPAPNNFRAGDGLNTAGYTWNRKATSDFNVYTARVDHSFNDKNRVGFRLIRQDSFQLNGFLAQPLPDSPGGTFTGKSEFYAVDVTTTISPSLVNEFNAGASRDPQRFNAPWELEAGKNFFSAGSSQFALDFTGNITDPINQGNDPQGRVSPFYTYGDKITWLRGRHEIKAGVEFRFSSTNGFNSFDVFPRAVLGAGGVAITGLTTQNIPALGQNQAGAQNMLVDLAGSLANLRQAFNSPGGQNPVFLAGEGKQRTWKQREFSWFFRDNFKVRPDLTLNLGLRYEFYGVPFEANGKTVGLVNGSGALFGLSGNSFADLYQPGRLNGALTNLLQVGKNSPNPDIDLYAPDYNNLVPAVGFSWSLPWFGKDKTVLRFGYGVGYERNSLRILDVIAGDQPGLRTTTTFVSTNLLNLANASLPLQPAGAPLATVPLDDRTQTVRAFDSNLRTPYVQNWNLTIQREVFKGATFEARYVGNKGTKLIRGANINEQNIFASAFGETLLDAFKAIQEGRESVMMDRIFNGLNLGTGVINGTTVRAGAGLRSNSNTQTFFVNNNVAGLAGFINNTNQFTGVRGLLLRRAGLPENFFVGNPQFAAASYTGNLANSSFHSLQLEFNKRFSHGVLLQSNYTWSKALGEEEGSSQEQLDSYRDGRNRRLDKRLLTFHIPHVWRTNAVVELPLGPGKKFLSGAPGPIARVIEQWQMGVIYNQFAGSPLALTGVVGTYNQFTGNTPTLVGNFPSNLGQATKVDNGMLLFPNLKLVSDPSRNRMESGLAARSTLQAVADASGNILLINGLPGQPGTLQEQYLTGPGTFRLDFNVVKRIKVREGWNFEFRADLINLTNTPQIDDYANQINTDINSVNFGRITGAGGNRIIVLGARLNF
ncbi:MAG TPA: TonB-dependent receptor [Blastocatellia bacterium]|nr:TonB-dependent receptor [Blastocatellia bacterium]HNG28559.1 TonB-dependent receptor [Blastocatellia bacterium]